MLKNFYHVLVLFLRNSLSNDSENIILLTFDQICLIVKMLFTVVTRIIAAGKQRTIQKKSISISLK